MSLIAEPGRRNRIRDLLRDCKSNGKIFIKSTSVVEELKKADPRINIKWNDEDRTYEATYYKGVAIDE